MEFIDFYKIINQIQKKSGLFLSVNFGCRVNAAETNQLSQILVDNGFTPQKKDNFVPDVILINTCSITKKGDIESLNKVRSLNKKYPDSIIFVTGCANLKKVKDTRNIHVFDNQTKEKILNSLECAYTKNIKDKFSHTDRFLLKVQSGCTAMCSYCTVPYQRQYTLSLSIENAVNNVNNAIKDGYKEVILTGVNLNQYQYGFSNLVEALLKWTEVKLISFGSIPINCVDDKFLNLYQNPKYSSRLSNFLHIPIQSGSDKTLKVMNRQYDQAKILSTFSRLSAISNIQFGTDIIVGFPGETEKDFNETVKVCQKVGFKKIHAFKFSPRPRTLARYYYEKNEKLPKSVVKERSKKIITFQTKLPFRQKPGISKTPPAPEI